MIKDQFSYYEQIDEYLSGKMSLEARESFEKQIETDADLKEEVSVQKDLRDLVIGASLQDLRSRMENDLNEPSKSNRFKKPTILLLALLSLTSIGLISYHYFSNGELQETKTSETYKNVETKKEGVGSVESSNNKTAISPSDHSNHLETIKSDRSTSVTETDIVKNEDKIKTQSSTVKRDTIATKEIVNANPKVTNDARLPNKKTQDVSLEPLEAQTPLKLGFSGKLITVKSEYQKQNGQIIIEGKVSGGVKPYIYLVNEQEFLEDENISPLEPGIYTVKVVDALNKTIILGETMVKEEICVLDYNESFILAFDANWAIPVVEDQSFSFSVYSQNGIVYQQDFGIGEEAVWNGITNNGSNATVGFYRFEIVYSDGRKCFGELTIGN